MILQNNDMNTQLNTSPDDLLDWDHQIYNTLSQKAITKDLKKLEKQKENKA